MNVLLLSQFFSTTRGGGEYLFSLMATNLVKKGHKVWVVTNKITDEKYQLAENVNLVFVKPDLKYSGGLPTSLLDNIRYSINAITLGLKIIKKEKIDIIHSNNFSPALAGSLLSLLTSKPHVTSVWDIFSLCGKDYWNEWTKQAGISRIHGIIGPLFEKMILRLPHDAIHTISDASHDDLQKYGERKPIHIIQPAIDDVEQKYNHTNSFQFIYIGRLVFYKNIEILIKAIDLAKKKEPEIKLVIVGGGPHRKTLEDLVHSLNLEKNIQFMGYVTAEEKIQLISSSVALAFPSLCEGFGLVILEAFQQKKPVLVSDTRPMSDIVFHRDTGFVLNPHSEETWAEHMLELAQNTQLATKMGQNGYRLLEKSYSQGNMVDKIIIMYKSVLRN